MTARTDKALKVQKTYRLGHDVVSMINDLSNDLSISMTTVLEKSVRAFSDAHKDENPSGMLRLMGQKLIRLAQDIDDEWSEDTDEQPEVGT